MSAPEHIREIVRRRYADAATRSAAGDHEGAHALEASCCEAAPTATADPADPAVAGSCCGPAPVALTDRAGRVVERPVLIPLAGVVGAGVPAAHGDHHVGGLYGVGGQDLGLLG